MLPGNTACRTPINAASIVASAVRPAVAVLLHAAHAVLIDRLGARHQRHDEQNCPKEKPDSERSDAVERPEDERARDDDMHECHGVQEPIEALPPLSSIAVSTLSPINTSPRWR